MIKKILASIFILFLVFSLVSCKKQDTSKNDENSVVKKDSMDISTNKAEITIYVPKGVKFDKKYLDDNTIAINELPKVENEYTDTTVQKIVNSVDKNVKVLIISSEFPGLEKVFDEVKAKIPGVLTIASDMGEFKNDRLDNLLRNMKVDIGFLSNPNNGIISAINAQALGGKKFIYLYTDENLSTQDLVDTKKYCEGKGMNFEEVKIESEQIDVQVKKYLDGVSSSDLSCTAVFPSDSKMSKIVLEEFKTKGFILPNLNSGFDGRLFMEVFGIQEKDGILDKETSEKEVEKVLKKENLNGKIGMVFEDKRTVPIELCIEVAKFMYEKNFMIEECFRDVSVVARGNEKLNLIIDPQSMGVSSGYFRQLTVTPRLY